MGKLFGTDGIRGVANQYPMTSEVAIRIGRAVAKVFREPDSKGQGKKKTRAKIVIGKDTRLSGYMIEQALASGICSMGADVLLVGPLPTPGIAYITQSMRADAGIVISASHNLYSDNGEFDSGLIHPLSQRTWIAPFALLIQPSSNLCVSLTSIAIFLCAQIRRK